MNIPKQEPEVGPNPAWLRNNHQMIIQLSAAIVIGLLSHPTIEVKSSKHVVDYAIDLAWEIHKREQSTS